MPPTRPVRSSRPIGVWTALCAALAGLALLGGGARVVGVPALWHNPAMRPFLLAATLIALSVALTLALGGPPDDEAASPNTDVA